MSTRVYLSKNPCQTTQEENTPVCIRIQARHATVKALQARLQDAYRRDDVRLVRRISVLLDLLTQTASATVRSSAFMRSTISRGDARSMAAERGLRRSVMRGSGTSARLECRRTEAVERMQINEGRLQKQRPNSLICNC